MVWNRIASMVRRLGFDYELDMRRSEDREHPIYIVRVMLGDGSAAEFATQSNDKTSEARGGNLFKFRISDNRRGYMMPIYSNSAATEDTVLVKTRKYLDGFNGGNGYDGYGGYGRGDRDETVGFVTEAVVDRIVNENSYKITKHNKSEMNSNRNTCVESITNMVMDRILNESQMYGDLDEGFLGMFNGQKAQNRQNMRKANRELNKSGDPNAKQLIQQNRASTRAANKGIRQNGTQLAPRLNTTQNINAQNNTQAQPEMLGNVNVNDKNTWPNDVRSAMRFVEQFQNNPTKGAGWLRNVSSLTNNQEFVQHVRSIINNYYAQRKPQQAQQAQPAQPAAPTAAPAQGQMAQNTAQPVQEGRIRITESELAGMVRKAISEALSRKKR